MKSRRTSFLIILVCYVVMSVYFQTSHPPVWPDEAIYAEISQNIISNGTVASNLWGDAIVNIQKKAMWNPPLFFYTYAAWQKIWGVSIQYQRMLVQIIGALSLFLIYLIIDKKKSTLLLTIVPLLLWISNIEIMKSSRLARPEMFVLLYGLLSIYVCIKSFANSKLNKNKNILLLICGVFDGFAILNHIIGIVFIIGQVIFISLRSSAIKEKGRALLLLSTSFLLTISLWLLDIVTNQHTFIQQFMLSSYPRSLVQSWLQVQLTGDHPLQLTVTLGYLVMAIFALLFFVYIRFFRVQKIPDTLQLIIPTMVIFWFFAIKGKSDFYSIYPITLTIIVASYTLLNIKKVLFKKVLLGLMMIVLSAQFAQFYFLFQRTAQSNFSYTSFADQVASYIPENTTVFISSIPDPYYALIKKKVRIYEFPAVPIAKEKYLKLLDNSDYIIYTGHYEVHLFGDFLEKYIRENTSSVKRIDAGGYTAFIFKLK